VAAAAADDFASATVGAVISATDAVAAMSFLRTTSVSPFAIGPDRPVIGLLNYLDCIIMSIPK
jgi:hypothetical protein